MTDRLPAVAAGLMAGPYANQLGPDSVQDHALRLLQRNRAASADTAIHLDLSRACGSLAEPLSQALNCTYVAARDDPAGLTSLAERGFETHRLQFGGEEAVLRALRQVVGGRRLASVSMLDTLQYLPDAPATLRALARLAAENSALVVVSAPNMAHADIVAKLVLGRLDVTNTGLLHRNQTQIFTAARLDAELRAAGLRKFDEFDTRQHRSDQHFPQDHPLLAPGTEIGVLLRHLREQIDPAHSDVLQLVRICVASAVPATNAWADVYAVEERPFLSTVIRTQGRRLHTLREALLSLHAQTDRDIEIIVVGHRLSPATAKEVEQLIDDQPQEMRSRSRLLRVDDGGRTRPLNVGFSAASGRYVAILDDDDIPFAHWVETFRKLHQQAPGRLLRASCLRQSVRNVAVLGHVGLRAEGSPSRIYPPHFDPLEHLRGNFTPPVAVAFPRGVFHDLGMRFDETLTTTEDWDFIMRVGLLVGTQSSSVVTGLYRWWDSDESSRSVHGREEWDRNHAAILNKIDASPLLLPAGTARRIRNLLDARDRLTEAQAELESQRNRAMDSEVQRARTEACLAETQARLAEAEACLAGTAARAVSAETRLRNTLASHSWRMTAILRLLSRAVYRRS